MESHKALAARREEDDRVSSAERSIVGFFRG
jgi:hypothetical protein